NPGTESHGFRDAIAVANTGRRDDIVARRDVVKRGRGALRKRVERRVDVAQAGTGLALRNRLLVEEGGQSRIDGRGHGGTPKYEIPALQINQIPVVVGRWAHRNVRNVPCGIARHPRYVLPGGSSEEFARTPAGCGGLPVLGTIVPRDFRNIGGRGAIRGGVRR